MGKGKKSCSHFFGSASCAEPADDVTARAAARATVGKLRIAECPATRAPAFLGPLLTRGSRAFPAVDAAAQRPPLLGAPHLARAAARATGVAVGRAVVAYTRNAARAA